jgi:hypothetical protein
MLIITIPIAIGKLIARGHYTAHASNDNDVNAPVTMPRSSVGTVTGYGLDDPRMESRWRRDFLYLFQTGPGAHPTSCKMGTGTFAG